MPNVAWLWCLVLPAEVCRGACHVKAEWRELGLQLDEAVVGLVDDDAGHADLVVYLGRTLKNLRER